MKRIVLVFALLAMCSVSFNNNDDTSSPSRINRLGNSLDQSNEVVYDYKDILRLYYDIAVENADIPSISFEDYCDEFYSEDSDKDLEKSLLQLSKENNNYVKTAQALGFTEDQADDYLMQSEIAVASILSPQTDYFVGYSGVNSVTPYNNFARAPSYLSNAYSNLKVGDMVYEPTEAFYDGGHIGIIVDLAHPAEIYGTYIQTVEAVPNYVHCGFIDDVRMVEHQCLILRANVIDDYYSEQAAEFAKNQVGKPYSLDIFRLNTNADSSSWYCSELVYAAYYSVNLDIGVKYDSNGYPVHLSAGCLPPDIYNSFNTYVVNMNVVPFLRLSVEGKVGTTWKISIYNPYSTSIKAYYNSKMCNSGDAENWTSNLVDVVTRTIPSHSSITVDINENWWATHIVVSFLKSVSINNGTVNRLRFNSFANNLNASSLTLTQNNKIIRL